MPAESKCWRLFVPVLSMDLKRGPWNKPQMCLQPCSHGATAFPLFLFPSRFYRVLDQASRIPVWLLISKSLLQTRVMPMPCHTLGRTAVSPSLQKGLQGQERMQKALGRITGTPEKK